MTDCFPSRRRLWPVLMLVFSLAGLPPADGKGDDFFSTADLMVTEQEPNPPAAPQQLAFDFINDHVLTLGVAGNLADTGDVDSYQFNVPEGGKLDLKFLMPDADYQTITAFAAFNLDRVYFIVDNTSLWVKEPNNVSLLAPADELAAAAQMPAVDLLISDIALTSDEIVLLTLRGRGDILAVDANNYISRVITTEDITTLTGWSTADLTTIAVEPGGAIHVADQASSQIIKIENDFSHLQIEISEQVFDHDLKPVFKAAMMVGVAPSAQTTVLARRTEGNFNATSLAVISGSSLYADGFYVTQFRPALGGDGGITLVEPNETDPNHALFSDFFDPSAEQIDFSPTALALAGPNNPGFDHKLYLGTFGPNMGDAMDGQVYQLQADGSISQFAQSFVDESGDPAYRGGSAVTGFFDVIDLAFSPNATGEFGNYLYLLSENGTGSSSKGLLSDLWRIDSDGVAHLFVADIVDSAGSLAFDSSGKYGGDLFIATWPDGSQILRVDSQGNTSVFHQFEEGAMVLDMAFAPPDSAMEGEMVLSVFMDPVTMLISLDPNDTATVWARVLETGSVPSGDIYFDENGNLYILQEESKSISRVEYQHLLDYELQDLQLRPRYDEGVQIPNEYIPYLAVFALDQPWILRLDSQAATVTPEIEPYFLIAGDTLEDGSVHASFTFDEVGNIWLYLQNSGYLITGSRSDANEVFEIFHGRLDRQQIIEPLALQSLEIPQLALAASDSGPQLLALAGNARVPVVGESPASQAYDDVIAVLGDPNVEQMLPARLLGVTELSQMQLAIDTDNRSSQPYEFPLIFAADPNTLWQQTFTALKAGNFTLTISPVNQSHGDYQFLLGIPQVQQTLSAPVSFFNAQGEQLRLDISGKGRALLTVTGKPSGTVVTHLDSLLLSGGASRSQVSLMNLDDSGDLALPRIILAGSWGLLRCEGTIDSIEEQAGTKGIIYLTDLGTVYNVQAPHYYFYDFQAENLGDPNADQEQVFDAWRLRDLTVQDTIGAVRFFAYSNKIIYRNIRAGAIVGSTFYGRQINNLEVAQNYDASADPNTLMDSTFILDKALVWAKIHQGNVANSIFYTNKTIGLFEVEQGSFVQSAIQADGKNSAVYYVFVDGDITDSFIIAGGTIKQVHADGAIANSQIQANDQYRSKIYRVSSGGDFSGSIDTHRLQSLLVGFDRFGDLKSADEGMPEPIFSGSVHANLTLNTINVAGSIQQADINCPYGSINSIFSTGDFDATVSAWKTIDRIIVGFVNGRVGNNSIADPQADVAGSISAAYLGRLYYTGERDPQLTLPADTGPITHFTGQ